MCVAPGPLSETPQEKKTTVEFVWAVTSDALTEDSEQREIPFFPCLLTSSILLPQRRKMLGHGKLASCPDRNSSCRSALSARPTRQQAPRDWPSAQACACLRWTNASSLQLLKAQRENTCSFPLNAVCSATNSEPPGPLERDPGASLEPHLSEPTGVTLASESSGLGASLAP